MSPFLLILLCQLGHVLSTPLAAELQVKKEVIHTCNTASSNFGDDNNDDNEVRNLRREAARWPSGIVPIYIAEGVFNDYELNTINEGIREIMSKTCIQFVQYAGPQYHPNYIQITSNNEEECRSAWIGMKQGGQELTLGHGDNCIHSGVVAHELMHGLGFWHEHVRYDRDNFVVVNWDNIRNGRNNDNFWMKSQQEAETYNLPYEMNSIMHYIANLFAIDPSKPTLISKVRGQSVPTTHRKDLSQLDARRINIAYNCRR